MIQTLSFPRCSPHLSRFGGLLFHSWVNVWYIVTASLKLAILKVNTLDTSLTAANHPVSFPYVNYSIYVPKSEDYFTFCIGKLKYNVCIDFNTVIKMSNIVLVTDFYPELLPAHTFDYSASAMGRYWAWFINDMLNRRGCPILYLINSIGLWHSPVDTM